MLTTHPHLAPRLKEEQSYTSASLWAFVACSSVTVAFIFIYEATSAVQIFLEEPGIFIFRVAAASSSDPTYVSKYVTTKLYRYDT